MKRNVKSIAGSAIKPYSTKARGFTLIEVLVVVLIIGVLAAIALPQYQKAVIKSRITQMWVLLKVYEEALDLYFLENGVPETRTFFSGQTLPLGFILPKGNASERGTRYTDYNDIWAYVSGGGDYTPWITIGNVPGNCSVAFL